jgi:hypothetical protein
VKGVQQVQARRVGQHPCVWDAIGGSGVCSKHSNPPRHKRDARRSSGKLFVIRGQPSSQGDRNDEDLIIHCRRVGQGRSPERLCLPSARQRRAYPGHLRGARASHPPARRRRAYPEHQDAQTPLSTPCGRRGQGGCGANAQRNGVVVIAARPQSRATEMNVGRRGRCLGAPASRPRARSSSHRLGAPASRPRARLVPPGSAGVSPACAPEARALRASERPDFPFSPRGRRGAGGMRGNGARECRTSLISPKNSTLASRGGEMRGNGALQQRDHRLRRASSRMACRLRISATSYLVGIEPAIGRIFTIAGNCPERP